jgi:hypothetical protein
VPDAIESYILTFPPEQQAIIHAVRALILATMPGVKEYVYHGALGYGVTPSPLERHCYVAPQAKGYVNLGFFFGARLADPTHLLEGTGARMRHVKIRSADEVAPPALRGLLEAAWADAPALVAALRARRGKAGAVGTAGSGPVHDAGAAAGAA